MGDTIGHFSTKHLQGALFKKFRDQMMGVVPEKNPGLGKSKPAQTPKKDNAKKKNPVKGKETNEESGVAGGCTTGVCWESYDMTGYG